jgi:hypothetical protein
MKRAMMRKLIFKFLDTKYPNAFVKQTIFGDLSMCGDDAIHRVALVREVRNWFDVTQVFAEHNLKVWISKLPVVVSIRNSTNPAVLVMEPTVTNTTLREE